MQVLRPVSVGLVGAATWAVIKAALFPAENWDISWMAVGVFVVMLAAALKFQKLHPIILIALGAVIGIVLKMGGA